MSDLSDLYQDILLQHNSKPRNFRKIEDANRSAKGYNPICGDQITVYLKVEHSTIIDLAFQGSGCAISRASASMMTQSIKGQSLAKATKIFEAFHQMLTEPESDHDYDILGDLESMSGVSEFPTRIKCAVLGWHALHAALEDQEGSISTE
jgi:nitrogen fixation NifU-like protein